MKTIIDKWRNGLYSFMRGRYGGDELNYTVYSFALFLFIINIFLRNVALTLIIDTIIIFCLYRSLSKKLWDRQKENIRFLEMTKIYRVKAKVFYFNLKDKEYKYFVCPNCKQMVKVPKGRGKIEISCPKCKTHFDRKS